MRHYVFLLALLTALIGALAMHDNSRAHTQPPFGLTAVQGLKVGHAEMPGRPTGCTVVLSEQGAVGGVDVRGSAPGTRETDLLNPVNTVEKVHAIVLAGGSAFGLDTATGVMRYLEEHGVGFETDFGRVPIVPAAVLFDLSVGDPKIRPDADCGYRAAASASSGPVAEGNVGAGAGATVGKLAGAARAMRGGLGTASITTPSGLTVAALISVLVPEDYFHDSALGGGIVAMLAMVALAGPVYVCATASVPMAMALIAKGVSPGAALVFLILLLNDKPLMGAYVNTRWQNIMNWSIIIFVVIMSSLMGIGTLFPNLFT